MGKIKILPENIANKIAAGEVVERPASVVKELVENSIDAGAANITVEVEKGGTKKIGVTDNGAGMDKEDLRKCFKRHGTSKIYSEDDLLAIKSLGFRGEALASIAAVSKVTLKSKTDQETAGAVVEVEGGEVKKVSAVGMPTGTSITVSDLYYNVPARKKFLKTPATEFRHILATVTNNALSFTKTGVTLRHNGKEVFALQKDRSREERVKELLGEAVFTRLIPVFFDHPHLKIEGFVSKPNISSDTRYKQYTFVNKRRVRDKVIAAAAREAYGTLLPARTYPIFLLYMTLPYEMVDVNVHPRKEEVKFVNSQFIFRSVKSAVSRVLGATDLTHTLKVSKGPGMPAVTGSTARGTGVYTLKVEKGGTVAVGQVKKELEFFKKLLPWEEEEVKLTAPAEIFQVHSLYLIKQTEEGILIVDQHAAHERILYEKFLDNFKQEKDENRSQPLLLPQTIDLSFSETEVLKENMETLTKIGFEIETFGGNSFKINAVPNILKDRDIVLLITELIEDLIQEKPPKEVDNKSLRTISFLACRSAIKAGDKLPLEQRKDLLEKLERTRTKYTCPHGRPVKVEISLTELAKMFKRK